MFAFLTASFTFVFSSSVNFDLFATSVTSGAFTSVDTVLSLPIVFGFSPSFVTVTLPSLSTAIWSSFRPGFAFLTASLIAAFSSSVNLDGSFTATFSGSFNSSAFLTVCAGVNLPISLPVLSFTVTVPSLPTVIAASIGRSGFAFLTASSTAFFSSSVNSDGFFTSTGSAGATTAPAFFTVLSAGIVPIVSPSLSFTVTAPSLPTSIVVSFGNVGLASLTASSTAFFSSFVRLDGSFTPTGAFGALSFSKTVSACESCPTFWSSPVPWVTVTAPSSETVILTSFGKSGFDFFKAAITLSFSPCVNFVLSATSVFSGATNLMILSVSLAFSTVSVAGILPVFVSPIGTVTAPLGSTWISSSVNPSSGLAALTASFTACFSASVSLLVSPTFTFSAGGFNVFPSLLNGFTVSFASNLPVFLPSAVVTVTLPLLSTSTLSPSAKLFFVLTALATASLSACVKLVGSFTSVFSGAWSSSIVSFCTTVWLGVNEPTLPPWLILTVPSASTVISSSLKFRSGLAALIASLTACFSVSFNALALSTFTGSFGGLNSFWTSFCFTVLSGVKVPVLPFLVLTVTVPSSATAMSALSRVGFSFKTASDTLSFSSEVKFLVSFTSTGVGSFKVSSATAFFSQTAYTVFGDVIFVNSVTFAFVASFLSAQPLKVYPSLVGLGAVTLPLSTLTLVVSLSSANLPPFASKVTATSSE